MIINASMRTDIPAFFSEWFFKRVQSGLVCARNPYFPQRVTRYRLDPDTVDVLSFCTKNPAPMLPHLNEIDHFRQFWSVTITPYGKDIEPLVPDKEIVMESFRELSRLRNHQAVEWRYDPIFISQNWTIEKHISTFEKMAAELSGWTNSCTISFIDLYEKTRRNFPGVREVTPAERLIIGKKFSEIGLRNGIRIKTCLEGSSLAQFGIETSGCLTQSVLEHALNIRLSLPAGKISRAGCRCLLENDIGAYDSCLHGCLYCYANQDAGTVRQNLRRHDPDSPFLIGSAEPDDIIHDCPRQSYINPQLSF